MLPDAGFAAAVRNFWTLFLLGFVLFGPLHIAAALVTQEPARVTADFASAEEPATGWDLDPGMVRTAVWVAEILLLPLLIAAGARVFERETAGYVPTVPDALLNARRQPVRIFTRKAATIAPVAIAAAAVILVSLSSIADDVVDLTGEGRDAVAPLAAAAARAAAAVFLVGPAAWFGAVQAKSSSV